MALLASNSLCRMGAKGKGVGLWVGKGSGYVCIAVSLLCFGLCVLRALRCALRGCVFGLGLCCMCCTCMAV